MSDLLGLGSQAVSAYRTALSAIGENVANAETPGYARREIRMREASPLTGSDVVFTEQLQFGGVRVDSVSRAWDQFRATDSRITSAAAGRAQARETWFTNVEDQLSDGEAGVGAQLGKFFNAGVTLAASPTDTFGRRSMIESLSNVASAFRSTADSLSRISQSISDEARINISSLNQDLATLAKVNTSLRQAEKGTPAQASLQDERDRLLDAVAGRIDVDVSLDAKGIATLRLGGSGNALLLDAAGPRVISMTAATDGRLSFKLHDSNGLTPLSLTGGTLAGLVDAAAVTADRRTDLDSQATDFAVAINAWSAQGRVANGNPGGALLNAPAGAASLTLLTTDPTAIAAGSSDGTTTNGNLLALNNLRGGDGAETRWAQLVAGHALLVNSAQSEAAAATTRRDNSFAARDEISGVDLDYEAAELMRFQQAYNGATKIIQVARETMQSILELF